MHVIAEVRISSNNVYGYKQGMALFYDVFQNTDSNNGAGIVYIWSNSWVSEYLQPEYAAQLLTSLTEPGYTVFLVYHGSAPMFKVTDAYADVSLAVDHIADNAHKWGVDRDKLGVMGGSAGGQLALMLAYDDALFADSEHRFSAAVAYYPPVDIRDIVRPAERDDSALNISSEEAAEVSPILFVSEGDPPTLLIHGDHDDLVPVSNSVRMQAELTSKAVVNELLVLEGGDHGFRNNPAHLLEAAQLREAWFERFLLQ